MDNDTQKLTSALADPTRFSIYQYVSSCRQSVTVQEVANHFSIHPNVARLHLSKLEDVNLLQSISDKSGKGGRPSRLYRLSDEVVSLQFPPRDYRLLSHIAIETLLSLGNEGQAALVNMGRQIGIELAKRSLQKEEVDLSNLTAVLDNIYRLVVAQGLNPEIQLLDDGSIRFRVYNCTFADLAKRFPESVCSMHNAMLAGIFETYLGNIEFQEEESITSGCQSCNYTVIRINSLKK